MSSIETSDEIKNISAALLKFQAAIHGVVRDQQNPHFRNRYASLEAVIEAARPGLQASGLAFTQAAGMVSNGVLPVTTMLVHAQSGEWMRSTMGLPLSKNDPQGTGSALTYACRYSLMAALGLPPVDDDGEATRRPESSLQQQQGRTIKTMADNLEISREQFDELNVLIEKSGADREKFLLAMNVKDLDDILASQFQRAKAMLNQKIALTKQIEDAKQKKQATDNGRTARHVG